MSIATMSRKTKRACLKLCYKDVEKKNSGWKGLKISIPKFEMQFIDLYEMMDVITYLIENMLLLILNFKMTCQKKKKHSYFDSSVRFKSRTVRPINENSSLISKYNFQVLQNNFFFNQKIANMIETLFSAYVKKEI